MSDFENRLQEQLKTLVDAHMGNFEKEVTSLQQSLQDMVKTSFGKVLETASQGLEGLAKGEHIAKLTNEMASQLATDKVELEAKATNLKAENEKLLAENTALAAKSPSLVETKTSTNLAILKVAINEIQANKTQSDVLSALVSQASSFSPRIALFIVKSGNAIGWMARGFDNEQANNALKGVSISLSSDTVLRTVLGKQIVFVGSPSVQTENQILFARFNNSVPTQVVGIPLLVRGKAAAVLYADSSNLLGDVINVEALEILVNMAGLAIELISIRPRGPEVPAQSGVTQTLAAQSGASVEKSPSPPPAISAPVTPLVPVAPIVEPPPPIVEKAPVVEKAPAPPKEAIKVQDVPPTPIPPPPVVESKPIAEETPKQSAPIVPELPKRDLPEPVKKVELPEISAFAAQPDSKPPAILPSPIQKPVDSGSLKQETLLKGSSAGIKAPIPNSFETKTKDSSPRIPVPPTWQAPVDFSKPPTAPLPPINSIPVPISHPGQSSAGQKVQQVKPVPANDEEQKLHNDARRFARLLVSEIKLYNEQKVLDGRKHSDLYDRLKEDIDRSRQMYDKRVSALVAAKYDYFYDELVNTLAEGDALKLGRDCPGPSVQVV